MRQFTNTQRVAAGGVVLAFAVGGIAFAFFTGGGTGSGEGTVGTSGAVTITATVPTGVTPGNSVDVTFAAANPTDSAIRITTVSLASVAVDAGHSACLVDDFTMPDVTEDHTVPANATAEALPTPGVFSLADTAVNQDACKGATLTLALTSS